VSGSTLVAIAAALDTTVGWLVGEDGLSAQGDDAFEALAVPGALDMLRAFAAVPSARARAALLMLVEEMAASGAASPELASKEPAEAEA